MPSRPSFSPDWVSPPGDTILDILRARKMSHEVFASQVGQELVKVQQLLSGVTPITLDLAERLERVLGAPHTFWMIRDLQFRKHLGLRQHETKGRLSEWIEEFPLKDMVRYGWLQETTTKLEAARECLDFFGVADVQAWEKRYGEIFSAHSFRTSLTFQAGRGATAAWIRQCEIEANRIRCGRWDPKSFRNEITSIRTLTRKKRPEDFLPELTEGCAKHGVAVVVVRALTGCRASGATRFLSPTKGLLALSARYLVEDHFWFTFFHEAGHLLLHGKTAAFLEFRNMEKCKQEEEANDFASKVLIPEEHRARLHGLGSSARKIVAFAREIGVSPGIVIGQLQHLKLVQHAHLNRLKRRYSWRD